MQVTKYYPYCLLAPCERLNMSFNSQGLQGLRTPVPLKYHYYQGELDHDFKPQRVMYLKIKMIQVTCIAKSWQLFWYVCTYLPKNIHQIWYINPLIQPRVFLLRWWWKNPEAQKVFGSIYLSCQTGIWKTRPKTIISPVKIGLFSPQKATKKSSNHPFF